MYIEKYAKDGRVYCGFFSDLSEYPSEKDVPYYIKSGELTEQDLADAESQAKAAS